MWRRIFGGGGAWRSHDPFDASGRVEAKLDLYHASYVFIGNFSCLTLSLNLLSMLATHAPSFEPGKDGRHSPAQVPTKGHSASYPCSPSPPHIPSSVPFSVPRTHIPRLSSSRIGKSTLTGRGSPGAVLGRRKS